MRMNHRQVEDKPKFGNDRELLDLLRSIDGSSYGAYRRALGQWDYGSFKVILERVQADPYAPPSSLRIIADPLKMGLPPETLSTRDQRIATGDFLIRAFGRVLRAEDRYSNVSIVGIGQEILERSAAQVGPQRVELRVQVQLPARGRTVQGHRAATIFDVELPDAVGETFDFWSPDARGYLEKLVTHVRAYEDYVALREALKKNNWVSFVGNGAILARRSGISELPMEGAVPFVSPSSLQQTVDLPHAGTIAGMAVPPGITLIVGGGYHGKSTVLSAIQRGVYAHIPTDGREFVATVPAAMKIRAADGRPVTKVDVSPFINHLPTGADTVEFSTQNASGSTSQAASIIEALGVGSPLLLIDEDTSATNLMIRDERMRELVVSAQEPITPLIDRIRGLAGAEERGVTSLILVMGGSGAYLDVADRVLQMDAYKCHDVTERAAQVCADLPRETSSLPGFPPLATRCPLPLRTGGDRPKTRASGLTSISIDKQNIDVTDVEQIVDPGQSDAIAWCLRGVLADMADGSKSLRELLVELDRRLDEDGLDALTKFGARRYPPFLVRPRMQDVAAALNRYRLLKIVQK